MALKFKCEKCGAEVVVKYPRPGEEALCPHCGAYVTVPETSAEAGEGPDQWGWKKRDWQFVPCPACGGDEINIIIFWGIPVLSAGWLRHYIKAVPAKCKKCGAQFDGLTGRSVDEEMATVRIFKYFFGGLYIVIGLTLAAIIISKTVG